MHLTTMGALRRLGVPSYTQAVGTSTARFQLGAKVNQSVYQTFAETNAASGDTRVWNGRLYFSTAGGSGETLRAYSIVNNVTAATGGTVNGAHISMDVQGDDGKISGAGNAIRATLGLRDASVAGGTLSGIQVDSNFATGATIPSGISCIRVTNTDVGLWPNLLNIPAPSNGTIFATHTTQTMTHSIRIVSDAGTDYYIMCTDADTNRG
jgi:hypothetical protein